MYLKKKIGIVLFSDARGWYDMRIFRCVLFMLCCFVFCTSCSKHNDFAAESSGLNESQEKYDFQSSCMNNLSLDIGGLPVCNTSEWKKWDVALINDEYVLKRGGSFQPAPPGMYPPALRIGEEDWQDYSVSFDFFIGSSGHISFVLYDNSNIFSPVNSYFEGDQRFWFSLLSNGQISFETTSMVDSYYLTNADGERLTIEDFDSDIWNTASLRNENGNLSLFVNGAKVTTISQFSDIHRGRLALDGSIGCMFRNICFE